LLSHDRYFFVFLQCKLQVNKLLLASVENNEGDGGPEEVREKIEAQIGREPADDAEYYSFWLASFLSASVQVEQEWLELTSTHVRLAKQLDFLRHIMKPQKQQMREEEESRAPRRE
jgi:hypothetical protein